MKVEKVIYIITSLVIGVLLLIYFLVDLASSTNPNQTDIIVFFTFFFLIEALIFYIYHYVRQAYENKVKKERRLFEARVIALRDKENPIEVLTSEVDKLKKDLNSKDSQLSFMMSHTGQGVILIDYNKQINFANPRAYDLLQMIRINQSKSYIDMIRFVEIKNLIEEVFKSQEPTNKEFMINQKNILVKMVPTGFEHDKHVLVLIDDLSERRSLESIKKDFFNFAGHELKTPITILKGYAELIYHQIIKEQEVKDTALKMINQTSVMTEFVDDMLMLSRLETYTDAPLVDVNLKASLDKVLESLKTFIESKKIKLRMYSEEIIYQADPIDIEKLFKNLIENSIKYNKDQGTIDIRLEKIGQKVIFSIQDSGMGIPKDEKTRIFERFYRISKTRTISGTGLGLSIVKHIVGKYHGTIDVDSVVDKYTRFTISL